MTILHVAPQNPKRSTRLGVFANSIGPISVRDDIRALCLDCFGSSCFSGPQVIATGGWSVAYSICFQPREEGVALDKSVPRAFSQCVETLVFLPD